ncbi:MAG: M20 family metallopeptidase [Ilumatobacteraceae bacterium]|jgi:glutamate carboxypeptidase|nr:M20 family metallopeptidase [Ilumatobacteraceae bacterium]
MVSAESFSLDALVADLEALVTSESPSRDLPLLNQHAELLAQIMERLLGSRPTLIESPVGPHIHWVGGPDPRVLILGHHDTVHPVGTLARLPFTTNDGIGRGPGIFDMKAGIVQALHGVAALADTSHIEILLSADEEIGSRASRALIEERARACGAVLVLEPSADGGALKIGRKGTGTFELTIEGRASHAGLEPEKGINSLVELAHLIPQIVSIADPARGTTVTPTLASSGTADNVVPARTTMSVDVRVAVPEEKPRVEEAFAQLQTSLEGSRLTMSGGIGRPPMHESAASELFQLAQNVATKVGITNLQGVVVGGGSDGNFTAAVGVQTLDGLGAVGGGAHGDDEHVVLSTMPTRAALIAGLCQELSSIAKRPPLGNVPAER